MNLVHTFVALYGLIAAVGVLGAFTAPARADSAVTVNPEKSWVMWDGWGCSLSWWANQFGDRDDLADTLFTTKVVSLTTDSGTYRVPGLGMNIVRYNIGGTSDAPAFGEHEVMPDIMPAFRRIRGFWLDWGSSDPASSSFNWSADAKQRGMMAKARARGADRFEAFSNAPMWWMCYNHSTAGSDGGGDNLQAWNYGTFASYLAIVALYARDHWGITFQSIEPFNEPSARWWNYPKNQEGCHFDLATQRQVIGSLRAELDRRGLRGVGLSASDENTVDEALATWNAFDAQTRDRIARVNVHGYSGLSAYRGPNREALYQAVSSAGKPLWMTEGAEKDGSGLTMAESIALDINQTHVGGWVYWQPYDNGGWGLIQANGGDNWIGPPNPRYCVLAQYSRHIRPGMAILDSGDKNTVAAYDARARKLVLVTFNKAPGQSIRYDLSGFGTVSGPVTRWTTNPGGDQYIMRRDITMDGTGFTSSFAEHGVQTFEIEGVTLRRASVRRVNAGGPALGPFEADTAFSGGTVATTGAMIDASAPEAAPPGVYRSERRGETTCTVNGLSPGSAYQVRLHFAETAFSAAGKRRFDVIVNGVTALKDFDIYSDAGAMNRAIVKTVSATADDTGRIAVAFAKGSADTPAISGLEILTDAPPTVAYTTADAVRALSLASGKTTATGDDVSRLDIGGTAPDDKVSLPDAVRVARMATGLDVST